MSTKLRIIILAVAAAVLLLCGYKLWDTYSSYNEADSAYESTAQSFVSAPAVTTENGVLPGADSADTPGQGEEKPVIQGEKVDWTGYSDPPPISVDFVALLAQWPDAVGWLYSEGTPINYPVMQGEDNDEYIHSLPDGTYNYSGSLFMEWTNSADLSDYNTIIYGHSMQNQSMFGSLLNYEDEDYFLEHPTMWYLTPNGNYRLDIVAVYYTPADSETYDICLTEEFFGDYLAHAFGERLYDTGYTADDVSRVIVLSTCSKVFDNARFVVVANIVPCREGMSVQG